ncbi:hypothetical protein F4604DRAFT_1678445 [Suillus subluteus]|nr:hypothetical protein F4604DRAFT_1678445 [Suillus subluteus]
MNCSKLKMLERIENDWPLDMGFDRMPGQLGPKVLDMGFTLEFDNTPLHMGFHPLPVHDGHLDQRPLDMGFATNVVQSVDIQPDVPLDMGFEIHHPVHIHPDQSSLWTWDSRYTILYMFIRISQWIFNRMIGLWTWALGLIRHVILRINQIFNWKMRPWTWDSRHSIRDMFIQINHSWLVNWNPSDLLFSVL